MNIRLLSGESPPPHWLVVSTEFGQQAKLVLTAIAKPFGAGKGNAYMDDCTITVPVYLANREAVELDGIFQTAGLVLNVAKLRSLVMSRSGTQARRKWLQSLQQMMVDAVGVQYQADPIESQMVYPTITYTMHKHMDAL